MRLFAILTLALALQGSASAQHPTDAELKAATDARELRFEKTVHDFGRIAPDSGPVSCSFTVRNTSSKPQLILAVVTSCSCTRVKWTRNEIAPGAVGTVDVTFTNEEGAHPFDKTVSVYTSDRSKPTVLHLRGIVKKK